MDKLVWGMSSVLKQTFVGPIYNRVHLITSFSTSSPISPDGRRAKGQAIVIVEPHDSAHLPEFLRVISAVNAKWNHLPLKPQLRRVHEIHVQRSLSPKPAAQLNCLHDDAGWFDGSESYKSLGDLQEANQRIRDSFRDSNPVDFFNFIATLYRARVLERLRNFLAQTKTISTLSVFESMTFADRSFVENTLRYADYCMFVSAQRDCPGNSCAPNVRR